MTAAIERVDCIVIGAGVVGLAVARALALQGREVMVLEAQDAIGTGTSSRNSEVIHAGIYYPAGSLKAQLCVHGRGLLYAYCEARGVPHQRCGKLIVATTESQRAELQAIERKARANGVDDLQWLERDAARALEPALECVAALLSPSTGIVDSHALMLALQGDLEHAGGMVVLNAPVARARCTQDALVLETADRTLLQARTMVNAAGLWAPGLARAFEGLDARHVPEARYAKGNYFTLTGRAPFRRLIYPVPEAAGLGVHLTLDLGGQARFGPDVQWLAERDPAALDYAVDPALGPAFEAEVRRYWPGLPPGALQPAYSGIRPKLSGPGEPAADFRVDVDEPGLVNLLGIESPGLTASLALAEHVAGLL